MDAARAKGPASPALEEDNYNALLKDVGEGMTAISGKDWAQAGFGPDIIVPRKRDRFGVPMDGAVGRLGGSQAAVVNLAGCEVCGGLFEWETHSSRHSPDVCRFCSILPPLELSDKLLATTGGSVGWNDPLKNPSVEDTGSLLNGNAEVGLGKYCLEDRGETGGFGSLQPNSILWLDLQANQAQLGVEDQSFQDACSQSANLFDGIKDRHVSDAIGTSGERHGVAAAFSVLGRVVTEHIAPLVLLQDKDMELLLDHLLNKVRKVSYKAAKGSGGTQNGARGAESRFASTVRSQVSHVFAEYAVLLFCDAVARDQGFLGAWLGASVLARAKWDDIPLPEYLQKKVAALLRNGAKVSNLRSSTIEESIQVAGLSPGDDGVDACRKYSDFVYSELMRNLETRLRGVKNESEYPSTAALYLNLSESQNTNALVENAGKTQDARHHLDVRAQPPQHQRNVLSATLRNLNRKTIEVRYEIMSIMTNQLFSADAGNLSAKSWPIPVLVKQSPAIDPTA